MSASRLEKYWYNSNYFFLHFGNWTLVIKLMIIELRQQMRHYIFGYGALNSRVRVVISGKGHANKVKVILLFLPLFQHVIALTCYSCNLKVKVSSTDAHDNWIFHLTSMRLPQQMTGLSGVESCDRVLLVVSQVLLFTWLNR